MIFFGVHKFGWVDGIEGQGMVATSFMHVMWIPLIPMHTMFILDDDSGGYSLPLSGKSVLVAYVRSAVFWLALIGWIFAPTSFGASCCLSVPLTVLYFAMPMMVRTASEERIAEIMAHLSA